MVKVKILQIACQKVLKQYCHKSDLRIKQKLKKMDLTSLVSTEKSWPQFYILWKVQLERKGQLKNVSY